MPKASKKEYWLKLARQAETITDKLGKPIDQGIKETVIALWANGIETSGSCEGHLDWGVKAPWVDIGEDIPEKVIKKLQKEKNINFNEIFEKFPDLKNLKRRNLITQKHLLKFLGGFYKNRKVTVDTRLILEIMGIYGNVRLTIQGEGVQEILPPKQQKANLKKYQKEMQAFTKFLKEKFFKKI